MGSVDERYVQSAELVCEWSCWRVEGVGRLSVRVGPGHCTDMMGAIRVGRRLMPDVREIAVVSGDEIDIVYRRDSSGWFTDSDRWRHGRRLRVEPEHLTREPASEQRRRG